jgi:hypothetical protein
MVAGVGADSPWQHALIMAVGWVNRTARALFAPRSGSRSDTYNTSVSPATRAARPHKFDALVAHIQDRDQTTKSAAQTPA